MFGLTDVVGRAALRAASHAAFCVLAVAAGASVAKAETRTLKFYHLHTHEKQEIAYKRNGRYLPDGLKQINWILRDWRVKRPVNMDPRLLDLVWEAYRQSGSRSYIQVICGYRSADTNGMLRSRTSGVAKESQHVLGKALDFTLPDVPLAKLRAIGLKMQIGGVGFYPKSGSPFVHFDVGNVRHWPKMSRKELMAVFPNGNTLHVPSDGKPLPGYEQALASYKSRKSDSSIQVANAGAASPSAGGGKTLLAMLFGGGGADEEEDTAEAATTPAPKATKQAAPAVKAPAAEPVEATIAVAALVPPRKPAELPGGVPLPIRDTFDTSAPKTMVPPAEIGGEAKEQVEVAALDPARIPLPTAAPMREMALIAQAAKVPVPTAPAIASEAKNTSLVAALATPPSAEDVAAKEAGQLAYAVPMPRSRPPFASVLKNETPRAETVDEIRAIVETASAEQLTASKPASPGPTAAAALAIPASSHPVAQRRPDASRMLAALETQKRKPVPVAKLAVPAGKTARFKRRSQPEVDLALAYAPNVVPASQEAIAARIRMTDLVTDPDKRAEVSRMSRPDAARLVRNTPTDVLAAGFTSRPNNETRDGFSGSAVNFMPMVKVD